MEDFYEEDYDDDYFLDHHHELTLEDGLSCSVQIGRQVLQDLALLVLYNVLHRITILGTKNVRVFKTELHPIISTIFGLSLLNAYFSEGFLLVLAFVSTSYVVFKILQRSKFLGFYMQTFCILTLVIWELNTTNPIAWHKIRGIQMIIAMKLISLAFDYSTENIGRVPLQNFTGYIFCPANLVYGWWMPYKDHMNFMNPRNITFSWKNERLILINSVKSICFVLLMNCFLEVIIPDSYPKWVVAYRTALSFRSSHYFISFMSQALIAASGMGSHNLNKSTKPLDIEIPRSLKQVVISWNIPMHIWLKKYIFSKLKSVHPIIALLATYLTSSLLHGLNMQIYAVLFSLALYTYVEHKFRNNLSERLNLCIKSSPCKNCNHHKNHLSLVFDIVFGIISLWHLTYLGIMFDFSNAQEEGYSLWHTFEKWKSLGFVSHYIILGTFIISLFI